MSETDWNDIDFSDSSKRRGRRHNGKMPGLLLAPYHLYGPAFLTLGFVILLAVTLLAG